MLNFEVISAVASDWNDLSNKWDNLGRPKESKRCRKEVIRWIISQWKEKLLSK